MNQDNTISIIGLGSLLCPQSAKRTCPNLSNFRYGYVRGHKRIFNKTDSDMARNMVISSKDKNYACLSAVPDSTIDQMVVSIFEIPPSEWIWFVLREFEYKLTYVEYESLSGESGEAVICMGDYSNDMECEHALIADPLRLRIWREFKSKYDGPMWRYDIFPQTEYLDKCIEAVKQNCPHFADNFLDTTFIGSGLSIREYLQNLNDK